MPSVKSKTPNREVKHKQFMKQNSPFGAVSNKDDSISFAQMLGEKRPRCEAADEAKSSSSNKGTLNKQQEDDLIRELKKQSRDQLASDPMKELDEALMDRATAQQSLKVSGEDEASVMSTKSFGGVRRKQKMACKEKPKQDLRAN